MTRLIIAAALVSAFGVFFSVLPAKTAPRAPVTWDEAQAPTPQSAEIHTMVGASFHAIHAGF